MIYLWVLQSVGHFFLLAKDWQLDIHIGLDDDVLYGQCSKCQKRELYADHPEGAALLKKGGGGVYFVLHLYSSKSWKLFLQYTIVLGKSWNLSFGKSLVSWNSVMTHSLLLYLENVAELLVALQSYQRTAQQPKEFPQLHICPFSFTYHN